MNHRKVYPTYFLAVPLAAYLIFFILPVMIGFGYSFTDWNMYSSKVHFVGLRNFMDLFKEGVLVTSVINTFNFAVVTTIFKNLIALALAVFLNHEMKTRNVLRSVYFLPSIISTLVVGILFISVFKADTGMFNRFLSLIGLDSITRDWLTDPNFAMFAVDAVDIWKNVGFHMVIYLAGLQVIPKDYYEASTIDGAGGFQKFRNVTLPLIFPAISINVLLSIITGFKVFDIVLVLTRGGPGTSTEVLNTEIFREFNTGRYAMGTVIGLVLFIIITLVAFITESQLKNKEVEL